MNFLKILKETNIWKNYPACNELNTAATADCIVYPLLFRRCQSMNYSKTVLAKMKLDTPRDLDSSMRKLWFLPKHLQCNSAMRFNSYLASFCKCLKWSATFWIRVTTGGVFFKWGFLKEKKTYGEAYKTHWVWDWNDTYKASDGSDFELQLCDFETWQLIFISKCSQWLTK